MQAKRQVLNRFPDAECVVLRRYPDGEPKYYAVFAGDNGGGGKVRLDIHEVGDITGWGGATQGATAAWKSAYFWCHRNPEREASEAA